MKITNKKAITALVAAALISNAVIPMTASAGVNNSVEKFGDGTYADRFLSLYDDVVTNGIRNGYMSAKNAKFPVEGGEISIPFHSIEEIMCEAPDYGHVTTSEAMSYLVWVAAMRDNLTKKYGTIPNVSGLYTGTGSKDLESAWKVIEELIPTKTGEQQNLWANDSLATGLAGEGEVPMLYPTANVTGLQGTTNNPYAGEQMLSPFYSKLKTAYGSTGGFYLMHWLADVDDWYGYGSYAGSTGKRTFINTFQRGSMEGCFNTVPHPSIEKATYKVNGHNLTMVFTGDDDNAQWRYTTAPDAEDRALQAVGDANLWGVGSTYVTPKAGMMADFLRNAMYDKYYQKIGFKGTTTPADAGNMHYLRAWYSSWGGSLGQYDWAWSIGSSDAHEFYQNVMATYYIMHQDTGMVGNMKATDALKDYAISMWRVLDMYDWLQSSEGPFAGGVTNSWNGRYESYPANTPEYYGMAYVEHPVYLNPPSNHWIGNQVWATQRMAQLYYITKQNVMPDINFSGSGLTGTDSLSNNGIEKRLEKTLGKWVEWAVTKGFTQDITKPGVNPAYGFGIPSNLDWDGKPDTLVTGWSHQNSNLHSIIRDYSSTDIGCIASWCDTLVYYAKAVGAVTPNISADTSTPLGIGEKALAQVQIMLDALWTNARDDWGVTVPEGRGDYAGIFEKRVYIPTAVVATSATAPNGAVYTGGSSFKTFSATELATKKAIDNHNDDYFGMTKFIDLRPMYKTVTNTPASGTTPPKQVSWTDMEEAYANYKAGDKDAFNADKVKHSYHRFWGQGDYLMALGVIADLYPQLSPTAGLIPGNNGITFTPSSVSVAVGGTATTTASATGTAVSSAPGVATVAISGTTVTVTGVSAGTATVTVTDADGNKGTFTVTVTASSAATTPAVVTSVSGPSQTSTPGGSTPGETTPIVAANYIWGDVDESGDVEIGDIVLINKFLVGRLTTFKSDYPKGWIQAHTRILNDVDPAMADSLQIVKHVCGAIPRESLKPSNV